MEAGKFGLVVLASQGYPAAPKTGDLIYGIDEAKSIPGVEIFHAGTSALTVGEYYTAGGRVLGVTAAGDALSQALAKAYEAAAKRTAGQWRGASRHRAPGARTDPSLTVDNSAEEHRQLEQPPCGLETRAAMRYLRLMRTVIGLSLLAATAATAATARAEVVILEPEPPPPETPFDRGKFSLGVYGGSQSMLGERYFGLGAAVGYFVLDGVEPGLGSQFLFGDGPNIGRLTPALRYVAQPLVARSPVVPYVGVFYNHWFIGDIWRRQIWRYWRFQVRH